MNGKISAFAALALLAGLLALGLHLRPRQIVTPELGAVWHYPSWPAWQGATGFAYVFSGVDGWRDADAETALRLSRHGTEVFGIDTQSYLKHLNDAGNACVYLPGPLEAWSRASQRRAGAERYIEPLMLGRAEGATLVYVAMRQAPPLAFSAAVGADPTPSLPIRRGFCDLSSTRGADDVTRVAAVPSATDAALALITTPAGTPASRAFLEAITRQAPPPMSAAMAMMTLPDRYREELDRLFSRQRNSDVGDLPLVENPATQASGDTFAILYSGDGGWRDLDRSLAQILAGKGMPVVGVDALRYFWRVKSPEVGAADLARTIEYYASHWHRPKVALIGFSFGANVLPFLIEHLPTSTRQRIVLTSLLSPERTATFEINPAAWMGLDGSKGRPPIAPVLSRLDGGRLQCYYGEEEKNDSLCTAGLPPRVEVIRKRGGHHFDGNYDELADELLMSIPSSKLAQGLPH